MRLVKSISSQGSALSLLVLLLLAHYGYSQETVFTFMKSDEKKASDYFRHGNYPQALDLYNSLKLHTSDTRYDLQIARSYYHLHENSDAAKAYDNFVSGGNALLDKDLFVYAECLSFLGNYDEAIKYYKAYQQAGTGDQQAIKKIWQIQNREFLFEDSVDYSVKPLHTNSMQSEIAAVPYNSGFIFLSNRKRQSIVKKVDARNLPFYRFYFSGSITDSLGTDLGYNMPKRIFDWLDTKYQLGPVSFFNQEKSIAFIASGDPVAHDRTKRNLQLYFANQIDGEWKATQMFPYNDPEVSITSVAIQEDGNIMYFSSDVKGGMGGLDLYVCKLIDGQWSKPVNLGEKVNTSGDECFPSISGSTLYFASNGLAGLGGLDIFTVRLDATKGMGEPVNMGYPTNTNFDDFGLTLNKEGSKGYFTSNRLNASDDIYELHLRLQSYPYTITGVLKYKEETWSDAAALRVMPKAQLSLIDNQKDAVVATSSTNDQGLFNLTIPYFSQYRIKITGDNEEDDAVVSLDLAKTRNKENRYEIVVVKSSFKKTY
ncbi:MAG: tetratricopeptide repeat protein [Chryseolinea sp.]